PLPCPTVASASARESARVVLVSGFDTCSCVFHGERLRIGHGMSFRQSKVEDTAFAFLALQSNSAAVLLDDGLADGQSQSGAFLFGCVFCLHLFETLEDGVLQVLRHTATVIDHLNGKQCLAVIDGNSDCLALWREF